MKIWKTYIYLQIHLILALNMTLIRSDAVVITTAQPH